VTRYLGGGALVGVIAFVMLFARLNSGQTVTLNLGFQTLYRVPITYLTFSSLLLGMAVMLMAGIHSDLKVRRFLRERLEAEGREERRRIDLAQQDLFLSEEPSVSESAASTSASTPTLSEPSAMAYTASVETLSAEGAPSQVERPPPPAEQEREG